MFYLSYTHRTTYLKQVQLISTFSYTFSSSGSGQGRFKGPRDVTGFVYVADAVFGSSLLRLGLWICLVHRDPNQVNSMVHQILQQMITIYCENDNHCISIFITSGEFIRCFGEKGRKEGQFNSPKSLNRYGYLYVSDMCNSVEV